MFRILSALFLALGFHLLLFLIPFQQTTVQPQLTGKKGIDVQLHTRDNTPPAPPAPFQADTPAPVVVAKTPEAVPETIVPESTAVIRLRKKNTYKTIPDHCSTICSIAKKENGAIQSPTQHNTTSCNCRGGTIVSAKSKTRISTPGKTQKLAGNCYSIGCCFCGGKGKINPHSSQ